MVLSMALSYSCSKPYQTVYVSVINKTYPMTDDVTVCIDDTKLDIRQCNCTSLIVTPNQYDGTCIYSETAYTDLECQVFIDLFKNSCDHLFIRFISFIPVLSICLTIGDSIKALENRKLFYGISLFLHGCSGVFIGFSFYLSKSCSMSIYSTYQLYIGVIGTGFNILNVVLNCILFDYDYDYDSYSQV